MEDSAKWLKDRGYFQSPNFNLSHVAGLLDDFHLEQEKIDELNTLNKFLAWHVEKYGSSTVLPERIDEYIKSQIRKNKQFKKSCDHIWTDDPCPVYGPQRRCTKCGCTD